MDFDEALKQIGGFGKYQKWIFFLICWTSIPVAFHTMAYVFIAGIPDHHCASSIPNNGQNGMPSENIHTNLSQISKTEYKQCEIIHSISEDIDGNSTQTVNVEEENCDQWVYDTSQFKSTIVSKWDLVCSKKWMRASVQAVYMSGFLVGCLIFGDLSDRFGRRKIFLIATIIHVVCGLSVAFANSYYLFVTLWFFVAMATAGAHNSAYILLMEVIGPDYRASAGAGTDIFWAVGYIGIGALAYFIRDWVTLQLVLNAPLALQILYYWLLPESPRWLLMKGHRQEATATMLRIAKINGRHLKDDVHLTLPCSTHEKQKMYTAFDLIKTPRLRWRSLNLGFNWFVNSLVFYGLAWNVSQLAGSLYLNFLINGAIEIPAYLLVVYLLAKVGRRYLICSSMVFGGIACLALSGVPDDLSWLQTTLANVGKFGITGSFTVIYVFTAELTPTVIRNVGLGSASMCSRIGGMLAPYFGLLGEVNRSIPQILFGLLSVSAGLLCLCLPETIKRRLPDTIEDGESFGLDQDILCFAGLREKKNVMLQENENVEKKMTDKNESLLAKAYVDNTAI